MPNSPHLHTTAGRPASVLAMISACPAAVWRAGRRWHRLRAAARRLHAQDDRMLADIGITRSEIEYSVGMKLDRHKRRFQGRGGPGIWG